MKDEVKWQEKQDDEEELSGRKMTVNTKKKMPGKKEQLRQTAHSDQSSLPKIRLTCKQLALNYNKELILRLRAACDWLKYHSSIPGWRD